MCRFRNDLKKAQLWLLKIGGKGQRGLDKPCSVWGRAVIKPELIYFKTAWCYLISVVEESFPLLFQGCWEIKSVPAQNGTRTWELKVEIVQGWEGYSLQPQLSLTWGQFGLERLELCHWFQKAPSWRRGAGIDGEPGLEEGCQQLCTPSHCPHPTQLELGKFMWPKKVSKMFCVVTSWRELAKALWLQFLFFCLSSHTSLSVRCRRDGWRSSSHFGLCGNLETAT